MKKVLVANRGEVALRISRAVQEIGMQAVAVFPADDAQSLHVSGADMAVELPGRGAAAYLTSLLSLRQRKIMTAMQYIPVMVS